MGKITQGHYNGMSGRILSACECMSPVCFEGIQVTLQSERKELTTVQQWGIGKNEED